MVLAVSFTSFGTRPNKIKKTTIKNVEKVMSTGTNEGLRLSNEPTGAVSTDNQLEITEQPADTFNDSNYENQIDLKHDRLDAVSSQAGFQIKTSSLRAPSSQVAFEKPVSDEFISIQGHNHGRKCYLRRS